MQTANGYLVSFRAARAVWAAVSKDPQAGVRELTNELGLAIGTVNGALHLLRDLGYVQFDTGSQGARTIVVPFANMAQEG